MDNHLPGCCCLVEGLIVVVDSVIGWGYEATAPELSKHKTSTHPKLEHWGFIREQNLMLTGTRLVQARSTQ